MMIATLTKLYPYPLDPINKGNLVHKYLPKQTDIDKILKIIQRKVLKGTHLPIEIKRYKQVIYVVHTSKTYIYIYHKTNFHLPNQQ